MTTRQVAMRPLRTGYPVMTAKEILLASLWICLLSRPYRMSVNAFSAVQSLPYAKGKDHDHRE
jgi:hypothetical protein